MIGLGYIGLPTAAMFATHGHTVYGYDVNPKIIEKLRKGEIHIEEPGLLAFVRDAIHTGKFVPTDTLLTSDVYIVCVPSPVDHDTRKADLSYVESASKAIVPLLKKGDLVILETTVPARTTEDVMAPILETSGLDARRDIYVAHCPETVLPGNMIYELAHNHRVVGGMTAEATEVARELYATFVRSEIITTDAATAELVKLIENTYRDVNIALANEIALVCHKLGIDSREAIKIANKHPRVNIHQPGPGVGGHCIPVDPWFIVEQHAEVTQLMRTAREVNDAMPKHVVSLVAEAVKGIEKPRIALLGLAYKGNVDDVRDSPSFDILRLLKERWPAAEIAVNDPYVHDAKYGTVPLDDAIERADCILLVTDHRQYKSMDPRAIKGKVARRVVVDTRGMLDLRAWINAGFWVMRI